MGGVRETKARLTIAADPDARQGGLGDLRPRRTAGARIPRGWLRQLVPVGRGEKPHGGHAKRNPQEQADQDKEKMFHTRCLHSNQGRSRRASETLRAERARRSRTHPASCAAGPSAGVVHSVHRPLRVCRKHKTCLIRQTITTQVLGIANRAANRRFLVRVLWGVVGGDICAGKMFCRIFAQRVALNGNGGREVNSGHRVDTCASHEAAL